MSDGVNRRSQIDTETVRALLIINGGGVVALLTLLPALLANSSYKQLVFAILFGILLLIIGLVSAVIHNRLRRVCSLIYDCHNMRPPRGRLLCLKFSEPLSCVFSKLFMWLSVIAFFSVGSLIATVGMITIS